MVHRSVRSDPGRWITVGRTPDQRTPEQPAFDLRALDRRALERRSPEQLRPARRDDLPMRLALLADGHPSSPRQADGRPKPPVVPLRQLELPEPSPADPDLTDSPADGRADEIQPLTDQEYAEHVADIRGRLDKAVTAGLATEVHHTIDRDEEQWTPERDRIHGDLVAYFYSRAEDVPCDRRAVVAGGLSGAGKSTILADYASIDKFQYLTINPDEIKDELALRGLVPEVEGLTPMEASVLVHEESSAIARQLSRRALNDGKNIIWDVTMSSLESTEKRIDQLRTADYTEIDGIFVDISIETSVRRTEARHREGHDRFLAGHGLGGRYVPAEVIRAQGDPDWSSNNRGTFESIKHRFDGWSRYDNSVDGSGPVLAEKSERISHDGIPRERG